MKIRKNLVKLMVASMFVGSMTLVQNFDESGNINNLANIKMSVAYAYSDEAEDYYNRGEKCCSDGDYNRAIEYLTKAIQVGSDNVAAIICAVNFTE